MSKDPFKKVLQKEQQALKQDILHDLPVERYPERIDWLARHIAINGGYVLWQPSGKQTPIDRSNFDKAVRQPYLSGLSRATDTTGYQNVLDKRFPLGSLIIQYAGLIEGLSRVNESGIDPGEALGRLIARDLRRNSEGRTGSIASEFQAETYTPRGLVEQVLTYPELAETVKSVMPSGDATAELVDQLAEVKIATRLWDHQLMALCEWIHQGANGFVNMATATGKTVLGLAAVAHWTDSGALHPADAAELEDWFGSETPLQPDSTRASDVLIVTTDELLGVQWSRLFGEHCNTPSEFTEIVDQTISLPWGDIDIRSANAVGDTDPSEYRIAIFDEVHNYASSGGWGEHLVEYIDSSCPVLALTGSVSEEIERQFERAESDFPCVYTYSHESALREGVIPDFNWTLQYTPIDETNSSTAETLRETANLLDELVQWDGASYRLDTSESTDQLPSELKAAVTESHTSPVSFGRTLSNSDESDSLPDELLELANGMSNRLTYWWNLRLEVQPIIELVRSAMVAGQPTLLLTRSYRESDRLYKRLRKAFDDIQIQKLEQGEEASIHDARITTFDDWETERKILIGPGDRIGTGNDIQSVEVGINLARPGTGMSNSMIQRLGRLLRQPGEKKRVDFYHLLGVPPVESIAPMDGEHFVRDAAGFFAQTKTEGGSGQMTKIPRIDVASEVTSSIQQLEQYGGEALTASDATLDMYERAYVDAIIAASEDSIVIDTEWYEELFDEATVASSSLGEKNTYQSRTERVGDQLFITDEESLSSEVRKQITETSKHIHEFDLQGISLKEGLDGLNRIRTNLNAIETKSPGVNSARLNNVTTRVEDYIQKFDTLIETLISAQRRITLAKQSDTVSAQDLQENSDDLQRAISMSEELGRETTQFESVQEDIYDLTQDAPGSTPDPVSDPDPNAPIDEESGIQANEVSEYYESLWNLRQLTKTVRIVVDEIDKPMQKWCDFVEMLFIGEMDGYPSYGKLQAVYNEFSISRYREIYGNGTRTTEFHTINVKPLTATVQQLLESTSHDLSTTGLALPVAPESGTRLPVIVETEQELDRAVELLTELPESPSRAVQPDQSSRTDGRSVTKERSDEEGNRTSSSDDLGDDEASDKKPNEEAPLTELGGVTDEVATALSAADITTREQLTEIDLDTLADVEGISSAIAQRIKMQVG